MKNEKKTTQDEELIIDMSEMDFTLEFKSIQTSYGAALAMLEEWYEKSMTFDLSVHLTRLDGTPMPHVSVCIHYKPECKDEALNLIAKYTEYGV